MESLLLSCKALSSSTTCRFIPAHGCPVPSLEEARASLRRGEGIPHGEILREFGLRQ
jgi:hypothetical protein